MAYPVIHLHAEAPAKPAPGQACNGCGVCCAWQPCPLGMVISRRRQGACAALQWHDDSGQYRCGVLASPRSIWPGLPRRWQPLVVRLARRWISAGVGCDSDLEVGPG